MRTAEAARAALVQGMSRTLPKLTRGPKASNPLQSDANPAARQGPRRSRAPRGQQPSHQSHPPPSAANPCDGSSSSTAVLGPKQRRRQPRQKQPSLVLPPRWAAGSASCCSNINKSLASAQGSPCACCIKSPGHAKLPRFTLSIPNTESPLPILHIPCYGCSAPKPTPGALA